MGTSKIVGLVVAGLVFACLIFILLLFLVKILWAWTIPDLFPGGVNQGLVAGEISWLTAAKLALFAAVLGGFAAGAHSHKKD